MDLCLHLGAHKTATTYLQMRLRRNARTLEQRGVALMPLDRFRNAVSHRLGAAIALGGGAARREIAEAFDTIIEQNLYQEQLFLSDENLLGTCGQMLREGEIYPDAAARLTVLAEALGRRHPGGRGLTLGLAMRGHADFFASAWGQRIRAGHYEPFEGALRSRLAATRRGWAELIDDIRSAFPGARIVLWRYEDFAEMEDDIFTALLGRPVAGMPPLDARPMRGFSDRAIREIQRAVSELRGSGGTTRLPEELIRDVLDFYPKGAGLPGHDPWPPEERRRLDALYAADCAALAARGDLHWLRPDSEITAQTAPLARADGGF